MHGMSKRENDPYLAFARYALNARIKMIARCMANCLLIVAEVLQKRSMYICTRKLHF